MYYIIKFLMGCTYGATYERLLRLYFGKGMTPSIEDAKFKMGQTVYRVAHSDRIEPLTITSIRVELYISTNNNDVNRLKTSVVYNTYEYENDLYATEEECEAIIKARAIKEIEKIKKKYQVECEPTN